CNLWFFRRWIDGRSGKADSQPDGSSYPCSDEDGSLAVEKHPPVIENASRRSHGAAVCRTLLRLPAFADFANRVLRRLAIALVCQVVLRELHIHLQIPLF